MNGYWFHATPVIALGIAAFILFIVERRNGCR